MHMSCTPLCLCNSGDFSYGVLERLISLRLQGPSLFQITFSVKSYCLMQGFLSAQLSFPQLIAFGLALFAKSTNATRANLLVKGLPGLIIMLARLLGTAGYNYRIQKDREAWVRKKETAGPKPSKSLSAPPP